MDAGENVAAHGSCDGHAQDEELRVSVTEPGRQCQEETEEQAEEEGDDRRNEEAVAAFN